MNDERVEIEEDLQLAENAEIETDFESVDKSDYEKKRELLEKTKIVKQTWSISEIYQKIKSEKLILDPAYQREVIWDKQKQTAFIESLYMGIMIPPVYVVEIPGADMLSENSYEVVDGKQRLTAIMRFITGELKLVKKSLEYFVDIFACKTFSEVNEIDKVKTNEMLSSVLDIYVITANSPEFTKYDIFSRLNKGAEKLKVNEIRRAIYRSETSKIVADFITEILDLEKTDKEHSRLKEYKKIFTNTNIKRFDDYGRFYKSLAFYTESDVVEAKVIGYNARPRDMINRVLQNMQNEVFITASDVELILNGTLELMNMLDGVEGKDYIVDACIPFIIDKKDILYSKLDLIKNDETIKKTLAKSPATTKNVNDRLKRVIEILG